MQQAGVGSGIAFASRGVLQLGGSAGLRAGSESTQLSFTPQIGWFIFNNIQISAILDVTHVATDLTDDVTSMTILAEPSYHYPLTDVVFVFAGIGLGAAWETDRGSALAASPRLGAELLIGRSGVLTPSLSWMGTTRDEMEQTTALRLNLGYSVMW